MKKLLIGLALVALLLVPAACAGEATEEGAPSGGISPEEGDETYKPESLPSTGGAATFTRHTPSAKPTTPFLAALG